MTVLVTGSSGHLGEALVRTLAAARRDVHRDRPPARPLHPSSRLDRRPRLRPPLHAGVDDGVSRRDAAQAACGHPRPPGLRRHQHHRHAQPARRGSGGRRRGLCLHQHDERVRRCARAAAGARRRPGSPRMSLPVPKNIYGATKAAAEDLCQLFARNHALRLDRAADLALLPGSRTTTRPSATPMRTPTSRRTNISTAASTSRTWSAPICSRPSMRPAIGFAKYIISATTPFLARRVGGAARATRRAWSRRHVPAYGAEYARRGWRCAEASIASMSMRGARRARLAAAS